MSDPRLRWLERPEISVVIPSYNRPVELSRCLAAYAAQDIDPARFEVIVIDDGSDEPYADLEDRHGAALNVRIRRRPHAGVSAARNAGIELARAPLLMLGEDDLAPAATMVGWCLEFHRDHPRETQAALLHFEPDRALDGNHVLDFLTRHSREFFPFPARSGVYGWEFFWGGSLTCKRSIFRHATFDPRFQAIEDSELGLRLARHFDLRVHYERTARATFFRDITIGQARRRAYQTGYYRYLLADRDPPHQAFYARDARYARPADHILPAGRVAALAREISKLEERLNGVDPRAPGRTNASRVRALGARYRLLLSHETAGGWSDARDGLASRYEPSPAPRPAPASGSRPVLTASMIVRNEARNLGACLWSIRPLVDEVVIVDTGSTDGTKTIAQRFGAKVHDFTWCDDFSAARNFALDRSDGEWILYVDADERLTHGDRDGLLPLLADPAAVALMVRLSAHRDFTPFQELRLFRNLSSIRFEGVIHETIWPGVLTEIDHHKRHIVDSGLEFAHVGYEGDQRPKHLRNLPLLEASVQTDPWKVFNWSHLASAYEELGMPEQADRTWRTALDIAAGASPPRATDSVAFITYAEWLKAGGVPYARVVEAARELYPDNLHLRWMEADLRLADGAYAAAASLFADLVARRDRGDLAPHLGYGRELTGAYIEAALGTCHFQLGVFSEAARWFAAATKRDPENLEYRTKQRLAESMAGKREA